MPIWKLPITPEALTERGKNTMSDFLGIEFIEVGDDFLRAKMPMSPRVRQPLGIMNGGASCVLAETVGSTGANCCVDLDKFYCVGLDINTNHIKSIKEGTLIATARPYHIGGHTHVWGIEIRDQDEKLISINRLTMAVLSR